MRFGSKCDNMLYISLTAEGDQPRLTYSCKHCGAVEENDGVDGEGKAKKNSGDAVLSTDYADDQASFNQFATPFIRHDPTLPRVSDIACPNPECTRPPETPNEVIYVKYDPVNLKYLYHCVNCAHFWK
jgi:DNA-directed RNA polymerase subunit M/transcription elongation factor TFIIS